MKSKVDLIEVWPEHIDYPLHRKFLMENRALFNKIIIVFTQMNAGTGDYRMFVRKKLADYDITFLNNDEVGSGDWRNVAVNKALGESTSDWVAFMEQDFIVTDPGVFQNLVESTYCDVYNHYHHIHPFDLIYAADDTRMHPCFILIKREVLDKTSKDFSASPPDHDHFGQIQKDLMNWNPPLKALTLDNKTYHHMNGLSQNIYLLQKGEKPNFRPEEFLQYCKDSILYGNMPVELKDLFEAYINVQN